MLLTLPSLERRSLRGAEGGRGGCEQQESKTKRLRLFFSLCLPSLVVIGLLMCCHGYSINQQWCYVGTMVKSTEVNGAKTH